MNRNYTVFISHAGPDKHTIAIPLYDLLEKKNIRAFVDRKELRLGDDGPEEMQNAMETAPIGVFILSPEFAARKWPMRELVCFQKRERKAREQGLPLPTLIPVFYRLDIPACGSGAFFQARNDAGDNIFAAERFNERAAKGVITTEAVALAMKEITRKGGIENKSQNHVTNEDTDDMQKLRSDFIALLANGIERAVGGINDKPASSLRAINETGASSAVEPPTVTVNAGPEVFTPRFEVWENPRYIFSRMGGNDPKDPLPSYEAKARSALLNDADQDYSVVAIQGMPGVGKTCLLRALCHDSAIRARFTDGVYVLRLGADAGLQTFLEGLSRAVETSGGHKSAAAIRQSQSLATAVNPSVKWFGNRTCLFLLDDVWSKPVDGTAYLEALSRICAGGKDSALVFSTREKQFLRHKRVTHEVCLLAHEPRGNFSRSVLLRTATGNYCQTLESSTDVRLNLLLDACCGLPVALAVTGRAIFKMAIDMDRDYDRAISLYSHVQAKSRAEIIDRCADDEYVSLMTVLDTSINILDSTRSEDDTARSSYICAELHRSFCVLEKQQWVPVTMLWLLWNTASYEDADYIADMLSEVGLVDVHFRKIGDNEVKGVQLHDLVHDVATQNAMNANEGSAWHVRLIQGYASREGNNLPMQYGCREWWKTEGGVDKYVDENVVRHLIGAGDVLEAFLLVTRPQWIARQLESCGILSFERDIDLVTRALEPFSDEVTDRKDTVEELRLVRNCVRASLSVILDNPREVCFQIYARLFYAKDSSSFAKRIVEYAERHAVKPCLKTVSACVQQAETVGGKKFPCRLVRCVQVVENEGIVIAGCHEGTTAVFDMETCERKVEWEAHEDFVSCLAVTTDERFLVSGSDDKTAKVWDMTNDFAIVAVFEVGCEVGCINVTPDNQRCVVGDYEGTVSVWELESGRCVVPELGKHERGVKSVAVSLDGQLVASGDRGGVIKFWAMDDESEMDSAHSAGMQDNLGTSFLLRALVKLFQAGTGDHGSKSSDVSLHATLEGHTDLIRTMCFTEDGRKLVSGSRDKTVRLWDVGTGSQIGGALCEHTDWVRSVSLSAEEQEIFSVGREGAMCVWRIDGNLERRVQIAEKEVWMRVAKIISGGEKVVWCDGHWLHVTDVRSELSTISSSNQHEVVVSAMCVSPDGARVISGSRDRTLMVWDTATGQQVGKTIEGHERWVNDVAVTSDVQRVISVSEDETVRVWDLETHELLANLEGHSDCVQCVEISLDGKTAITGSWDRTVLVWDLDACDGSHKVLEGHSEPVGRLYLAQDGQHFVSLSRNAAILWNMETVEIVERVEKVEADSMSADKIEDLFGVPLLSNLRIGDIRLGSDRNKITYHQNGEELVLAAMDSLIYSMDFSRVTKTLCVGLRSGHVGLFKLELEDDLDVVLVEE